MNSRSHSRSSYSSDSSSGSGSESESSASRSRSRSPKSKQTSGHKASDATSPVKAKKDKSPRKDAVKEHKDRSPRRRERSRSRERERERRRRSRSESPRRRRRSPTPKSSKVCIARLTKNVTKDHVQEIFSVYGDIKTVELPNDRTNPHLCRGDAYVEYERPEEAEKAIEYMDKGQVDGHEITVSMVLLPRARPPLRRSPPRRPGGWGRRASPGRFRRSPVRRRSRSPRRPRSRSPVKRRRYSSGSSSASS